MMFHLTEAGATLYIRPYMFGSNPVIGVKPAPRISVQNVHYTSWTILQGRRKAYHNQAFQDFDRAAPHGTGHVKAGLNYAMSLHAIVAAHANRDLMRICISMLATRTKVEETGGANFLFVTKDGKVVTPKSNTILPSITRRSLMVRCKALSLDLKAEET